MSTFNTVEILWLTDSTTENIPEKQTTNADEDRE